MKEKIVRNTSFVNSTDTDYKRYLLIGGQTGLQVLYEADSTSKISSRSLASLGSRKQNKIEYLPLAEDLSLLLHL